MRKRLSVGDLKHRVVLQVPTRTCGDGGQEEVSYTDFATVRAAIESLSSREFWDARQYNVQKVIRVRIWYRRDVRERWRLRYDGRTYDIESAEDVNAEHWELLLTCREVEG